MSIVLSLYKQSLINRKNNAQLQLMQNNARMMNFLGTHQGKLDDPIPSANTLENRINLENASLGTELAITNSELQALNTGSIDYFA